MTNRRQAAVASLERTIGHDFSDKALLERALTHASVGEGARAIGHYERLEFLGDRVLNLLAAEWLLATSETATEGEMSPKLAELVNGKACARVVPAHRPGRGDPHVAGRSQGRRARQH